MGTFVIFGTFCFGQTIGGALIRVVPLLGIIRYVCGLNPHYVFCCLPRLPLLTMCIIVYNSVYYSESREIILYVY